MDKKKKTHDIKNEEMLLIGNPAPVLQSESVKTTTYIIQLQPLIHCSKVEKKEILHIMSLLPDAI